MRARVAVAHWSLVPPPHALQLVGVELCEPAVEDARVNATLNGIDNAVFVCDRAENVMQDVLARADAAGAPAEDEADATTAAADATAADATAATDGTDAAAGGAPEARTSGDADGAAAADADAFRVVAVVDPPRGGLMKPVLR